MNILGRKIKVYYKKCSECGHGNIHIEFHTKKWFKGKEFEINDF